MHKGIKRTLGGFSKYSGGIIDSKNQANQKRSRQVMTLFEQETEVRPNPGQLPTAKLRHDADLGVYNTPNLTQDFSIDVQLIWSLASVLYKRDKSQQRGLVETWIRDLVNPGLEFQLERQKEMHSDDPMVATFVYLTFGQVEAASEEAKRQGDYELGMFISHSISRNIIENVTENLQSLQKTIKWRSMSMFHKKCWYALAGRLGYIVNDDISITEGVYWQCVLGMYIWYGESIIAYNRAIRPSQVTPETTKTLKTTAKPDRECLWYQLLQWWMGDRSIANMDEWPLELPWLLAVYKKSNSIDEQCVNKFIDYLDTNDMAEWAIYALLLLENLQKRIPCVLRRCEWNNEEKLINEYHIPVKQIQMAKALNAHDSWDYESEYKHLLKGNLFEEAKLLLLYFLLPKLCQDDKTGLTNSIKALTIYLKRNQDDELLLLEKAYTYLLEDEYNTDTSQLLQGLSILEKKYKSRACRHNLNNLIERIRIK